MPRQHVTITSIEKLALVNKFVEQANFESRDVKVFNAVHLRNYIITLSPVIYIIASRSENNYDLHRLAHNTLNLCVEKGMLRRLGGGLYEFIDDAALVYMFQIGNAALHPNSILPVLKGLSCNTDLHGPLIMPTLSGVSQAAKSASTEFFRTQGSGEAPIKISPTSVDAPTSPIVASIGNHAQQVGRANRGGFKCDYHGFDQENEPCPYYIIDKYREVHGELCDMSTGGLHASAIEEKAPAHVGGSRYFGFLEEYEELCRKYDTQIVHSGDDYTCLDLDENLDRFDECIQELNASAAVIDVEEGED